MTQQSRIGMIVGKREELEFGMGRGKKRYGLWRVKAAECEFGSKNYYYSRTCELYKLVNNAYNITE